MNISRSLCFSHEPVHTENLSGVSDSCEFKAQYLLLGTSTKMDGLSHMCTLGQGCWHTGLSRKSCPRTVPGITEEN